VLTVIIAFKYTSFGIVDARTILYRVQVKENDRAVSYKERRDEKELRLREEKKLSRNRNDFQLRFDSQFIALSTIDELSFN